MSKHKKGIGDVFNGLRDTLNGTAAVVDSARNTGQGFLSGLDGLLGKVKDATTVTVQTKSSIDGKSILLLGGVALVVFFLVKRK